MYSSRTEDTSSKSGKKNYLHQILNMSAH